MKAPVRSLSLLGLICAAPLMGIGSGPYSPPAGEPGSTAIAWDDSRIIGWATGVVDIIRGPVDITNPDGALATYGAPSNALGTASLDIYNTVSLGDGGSITLTFDQAIRNGAGPDFAVFENSFDGLFLELAFVEVSSNGIDFLRFDAISLTQTDTQIGTFGELDSTNLYNLAGSFEVGYGTPFDLAELAGISPLVDVNAIHYVRIVDVVGSIDPEYARYDSHGNIINDPWKTNFDTGGFDLDAIAVLHAVPEPLHASLIIALLAITTTIARKRRQP